jgi:glycerate 2-kinase
LDILCLKLSKTPVIAFRIPNSQSRLSNYNFLNERNNKNTINSGIFADKNEQVSFFRMKLLIFTVKKVFGAIPSLWRDGIAIRNIPHLSSYHSMHILIATDKFKDSITARAVCEALKKGILRTFPSANCELLPLADGGEGTLETLQSAWGGVFVTCKVGDPLARIIEATYLWVEKTQTAVIEMARASGIELLSQEERNCLITSTIGTGELIRSALEKGATTIILTVGGSATNDAGIGMAMMLGYEFLDKNGSLVPPTGAQLTKIHSIKTDKVHPKLAQTKFIVATDVTNPFYGTNGAAHVFAPQKGADKKAVRLLDKGLQNIARLFQATFQKDIQTYAGSGAGGGIGGGAICLLNAEIVSAADWILEVHHVAEKLEKADILITGEGKIDRQTWQGKLISHLVALAEKSETPAILVCGTLQDVENIAAQNGVLLATSILNEPMTLENALANAAQLVENQGILLGKWLKRMN